MLYCLSLSGVPLGLFSPHSSSFSPRTYFAATSEFACINPFCPLGIALSFLRPSSSLPSHNPQSLDAWSHVFHLNPYYFSSPCSKPCLPTTQAYTSARTTVITIVSSPAKFVFRSRVTINKIYFVNLAVKYACVRLLNTWPLH